jgi:hypothetical protein
MRTTSQSGMSIFEVMWLTIIATGATLGGIFGYSHFGMYGVILGIPIGTAIGFLGVLSCAFFFAVIFKALWGGTLLAPRTPQAENGSNRKTKDA